MKQKRINSQQASEISQNIQDQSNTNRGTKIERKAQSGGKEDCSAGICSVLWKPESINRL